MYVEYVNNKKFPKKGADVSDNPEKFTDAGYLITENDLIVDLDKLEKPVIEKIISLYNIKTQTVWTERGAHFYFKKPVGFKGNSKVCPLGFEVEYKHSKNTKSVTVKRNGKMRIIENEGIREDLPDIFFSRKKLESLVGLEDSDGRNNKLFAHRMKIHDLPQWKSMLRFINNHIFAIPLEETEFQTVSREGVKLDATTNGEPEVADFLLAKYKVISYQNKLYFYEDEQYIQDDEKLKRLIFAEVGLKKTRYVDEVIKQLKYRAEIIESGKVFDIKLQNGILRNGNFIEVNYQDFTPYSINIPYVENAEPVEAVDEYLDHLTNHSAEYRNMLLEVLAHTLIVDKKFKRMLAKFFIFVGDGGNGKGTLLMIIREILGVKNCSGLSIKQMTDERYFTSLQGKLCNLGDDVQDEVINHEQMKVLKNISTCDFVASRNLFEQSKDVELTLSLIFTSNHILKSFEKGEAYKRRVQWMPMYGKPTKKDSRFIDKLTTKAGLEYWLKLLVDAYKRLYKNEQFTEPKLVQDFNNEYHRENNTVLQYLELKEEKNFLGKKSPEAYREYEEWAEENGLNVQSRKLFVKSLFEVFQLKTQPRKSERVFCKVQK